MNNNGAAINRLNFFTGFFTTAEDWNQGEDYHLEKRKLHNRGLHTPGVIVGEKEGLQVITVDKQSTEDKADKQTVEVKAGAALDGAGNLLYLATARKVEIPPFSTYPTQVYITIEFHEEASDFRQNLEDADFNGYARMTETPIVICSDELPDNSTRIELARIDLQNSMDPIKTPADPANPKGHEINCTQVKKAGAVDPVQAERLTTLEQTLATHNQGYLERMARLYALQLDQQRRHYRGIHTPGIVHAIHSELAVAPTTGLTVRIGAGLALDQAGNELYLPEPLLQPLTPSAKQTRFYLAVTYDDAVEKQMNNYLTDLAKPSPARYRTAKISVTEAEPDNKTMIELARLDLTPTATEIRDPVDPHHPQPNELDRRHRQHAGSIGVAPSYMTPDLQSRFDGLMRSTRDHFAEVAHRFPTPTLEDVRLVALTLKLSVHTLERPQLPHLLRTLAHLELTVAHELAKSYPPLAPKAEFEAYQDAVDHLLDALRKHQSLDTILTRQAQVAETAHRLAGVTFPPPVANAGPDQTWEITGDVLTILLDASGSHTGDKQKIINYRWEKVM